MTYEHLARLWFNHPLQHAIILRQMKKAARGNVRPDRTVNKNSN